jgi:uncharacterized membrane-anchored protein YhcB (DUF1043 family)
MRDLIGPVLPVILIVVVLVGIAITGWRVKRYVNYKWNYQSQVQAEIKPLMVRIESLEKRISELEKKE